MNLQSFGTQTNIENAHNTNNKDEHTKTTGFNLQLERVTDGNVQYFFLKVQGQL